MVEPRPGDLQVPAADYAALDRASSGIITEPIQGRGETINLAAVDENGHVLHFWRTLNNADWLMTDVSVMTHQIVVGPVAGYDSYADLGLPEWYDHMLAARPDSHLLVFTQVFGTQQWQAVDVSAITSDVAQGPFACWSPTFLEAYAYPSGIAGVKW